MTLSYLKALRAFNPTHVNLNLAIIQQEIELGLFKQSQIDLNQLQRLYPNPSEALLDKMRWLDYLTLRYHAEKLKPNSAKRILNLQAWRKALVILLKQPLETDELIILAHDALRLGQTPIALEIYLRLKAQNQLKTANDFAEGASIALQNNQPLIAAHFYIEAYQKESNLNEKQSDAIKAMRAFWAANQVDQALAFATYIPDKVLSPKEQTTSPNPPLIRPLGTFLPFLGNRENDEAPSKMLLFLTKLSLTANRPDLAEKYISSALKLPSPNQLEPYKDRLQALPFEASEFQLMYQSFLYNKQVEAAHEIARIAVKKNPHDSAWHQRLAKTSLWLEDYHTGIRAWLYVFEHTHNNVAQREALKVVKDFGYDQVLVKMLHFYLKNHPHDTQTWLELARAQNRLGHPQKALKILDNLIRPLSKLPVESEVQGDEERRVAVHKLVHEDSSTASTKQFASTVAFRKRSIEIKPDKAILSLMAQVYQDTEQWDKALMTWQKSVEQFGPDRDSAMAMARIYYHRGEWQQAYAVMKRASGSVKNTDQAFWDTLADISWMTHQHATAILALSHHLNRSDHLIRLIQLEADNPKQALQYSELGWKNFHHEFFFSSTIYLMMQCHAWQKLIYFITHLNQQDLRLAKDTVPFWQAQSAIYGSHGQLDAQKKVLTQGIKRLPNQDTTPLKNDLLWLEITYGEPDWLKAILESWYPQDNQSLWHAFAEAFNLLNVYYSWAAFAIYQQNIATAFATKDLQALIDYAGILDKLNREDEALKVRKYVWRLANNNLKQGVQDEQNIVALYQLAPYLTSGNLAWFLNGLLVKHYLGEQTLQLMFNALQARNNFDYIKLLKHVYTFAVLPERIAIPIALSNNDQMALQNIESHSPQTRPRPEHINAAIRLENTRLAESLTFDELKERPYASDIYKTWTELGLADANIIDIREESEAFINIRGTRTGLNTRLRLSNEWQALPYFTDWLTHSSNPYQIVHVPHDTRAGIALLQKIHRGTLQYLVGYRQALTTFIPADLELNYRLAARWHANLDIGLNQENFQTSYLRIGGVQDQVNLRLIYNLAKYDRLQTGIDGQAYYSQDRHYLGNGVILHGLLDHKFWLSYPDFTIGLFTDLYFMSRNGTYGGDITQLFPIPPPSSLASPALITAIRAANYQQIVPNSYYQGGVAAHFGDYIQDYSSEWRPYFLARLYYNTLTHLSNEIKVGLNGKVFGRDSLLLYAQRGTAPAVANSTVSMIGARYRLYF